MFKITVNVTKMDRRRLGLKKLNYCHGNGYLTSCRSSSTVFKPPRMFGNKDCICMMGEPWYRKKR